MVTINIQNQNVNNQYIADTINIGQSQTHEEFFQQLKYLQTELLKAIEANAITGEGAIEAKSHIEKALLQEEQATPDKKTLIEHLTFAKELVTNVEGLVTVFAKAITVVDTLF